MEFRVLGPLEVLDEGRPVDVGAAKQRALLAVLLLNANGVVSSDQLIEALWGERPPETAQKALQVYVSQLRKVLGKERILTRATGYVLRAGPDELDLERFGTLAAEGRLAEAPALWRGQPLADFRYEPFAEPEIVRLEELRLACLEERIEHDLAAGRHGQLVGELDSLVRQHPLRERLRAQLMLALYRSGRQAEALEAYHDARRALTEELGIEPSQELRELQQAILRQDPVLAHAVDELEPEVESGRRIFVGRDAELETLQNGLSAAIAGHGRLFLLIGEPGIGKSRLAERVTAKAKRRGARVLVGRCWEAGGAPAYWPWVQSLRAAMRDTDATTLRSQLGPEAADLAQLLPELREQFADLPELPPLESEGARFRLFEAVASFLRRAGETQPILLVLDDLHAADEPSLLLLLFVARELGSARLLVVGALRDVDPTPTDPLTSALTELAREPTTRILKLRGLERRGVARFVELASGEAAPDALVDTIYEETEGNPLFVGELVRLLSAEGGFEKGVSRPAIPEGIRDVISRRLRHLSPACNDVLVLASVLGREFSIDALARAAAVSEDELLEVLDEAMTARVVSDVPGAPKQLRFDHVLIRDTLYENLMSPRRIRMHRLALEVIEALYGAEPGGHLAELAHHAIAGTDFAKGTSYAARAGDRALDLLAYEEAARLYQMALKALELARRDGETRCELLLALGDAYGRAGNTPASQAIFLEAATVARELDLARQLARAAAGYGGRIVWARAGDDDRLVPLLEEGLAAIDDEDLDLRARLLARLSGALRDELSRSRRDAVSKEAVEIARRLARPATLAYALAGRGAAIIAPDTVEECLSIGNELCALADEIGKTEPVLDGHYHRLIAYLELGSLTDALLELEAMSEIADALRQPAQLWQVSATRAMIALGVGAFNDAQILVSQALELGERAQGTMAIPAFRLHRFMLDDFEGRLERSEDALVASVRDYPARPVLRCALAYVHAQLGRTAETKAVIDDLSQDAFSRVPFDFEWLYGASLLAEACATIGDRETAAVLYRLLLPYERLNIVDAPEGMRGPVARYLGLLAAQTESTAPEAHFEKALEISRVLGTRPWLARTQEDYARTLRVRVGRGHAQKAESLLEEALSTYRDLGMKGSLERARSLARV